jgi:hypothetical protein
MNSNRPALDRPDSFASMACAQRLRSSAIGSDWAWRQRRRMEPSHSYEVVQGRQRRRARIHGSQDSLHAALFPWPGERRWGTDAASSARAHRRADHRECLRTAQALLRKAAEAPLRACGSPWAVSSTPSRQSNAPTTSPPQEDRTGLTEPVLPAPETASRDVRRLTTAA